MDITIIHANVECNFEAILYIHANPVSVLNPFLIILLIIQILHSFEHN